MGGINLNNPLIQNKVQITYLCIERKLKNIVMTILETVENVKAFENYKGVDKSLDISLFEYGLIWATNKQCEKDELYFIAKVAGTDGYYYDNGYYSQDDINNSDLVDDSFLSYIGQAKKDWLKSPLGQKMYDLISYYGAHEFFTSYYTQTENPLELA